MTMGKKKAQADRWGNNYLCQEGLHNFSSSTIQSTETLDSTVIRERYCKHCKKVFKTLEIVADSEPKTLLQIFKEMTEK